MLIRSFVLHVGLLLASPCASRADDARPPRKGGDEPASARHYQEGMTRYAAGDRDAALVFFRRALRESPGNRSALTAVRRLESETAAPPAAVRPPVESASPPSSAGRVEAFLLGTLPRWFNFERTVGNGLSDVGTLNALNARVVQLLGERRFALAQNRAFRNERQLRELLRRAPVAT